MHPQINYHQEEQSVAQRVDERRSGEVVEDEDVSCHSERFCGRHLGLSGRPEQVVTGGHCGNKGIRPEVLGGEGRKRGEEQFHAILQVSGGDAS